MTEQQRVEKLKGILSEQAFFQKLMEMETAEEVQKALKDKGFEASTEEIEEGRKQLIQIAENNEELDKDQLKNVAGGFVVTATMATMAAVGALIQGGLLVNQVTRRRW